MTWFLIIMNLYGGQPTFIEMPTEDACNAAVHSTELGAPTAARAWCIPAGEWPLGSE